jgi:hypothetical protein
LLKKRKYKVRLMPEQSNPKQQPVNASADPNTWSGFLFLLITTKQGWLGITGVAAIVTAAVLIAIHVINPEEIKIAGVATISIKKGNTQNALFSLSPNGGDEDTAWVGTEIMVKKGDLIKITASGRVHTSLKRLIAEAQSPEFGETWVNPEGLQQSQDPSYLPDRNNQRLLPSKNSAYYGRGMLLAAVREQQGEVDKIEPIGENGEFEAKIDGELVLTVNDIWLDERDKDIYAPSLNEKSFKYY